MATIALSTVATLCGVVSFALALGALIGRSASTIIKQRETRTALAEQQRQDEILFRQAFVGTPANEYGPARPGVIDQVRGLTTQVAKLTKDVGDLGDQLYKLKVEFHDHVSATNGSHP